jgi:hypothetical protein
VSEIVEAPHVVFHIERDGKFYAYDRHGEDQVFWVNFGEPFMCNFESGGRAEDKAEDGDVVRVSIDGTLVSTDTIARQNAIRVAATKLANLLKNRAHVCNRPLDAETVALLTALELRP